MKYLNSQKATLTRNIVTQNEIISPILSSTQNFGKQSVFQYNQLLNKQLKNSYSQHDFNKNDLIASQISQKNQTAKENSYPNQQKNNLSIRQQQNPVFSQKSAQFISSLFFSNKDQVTTTHQNNIQQNKQYQLNQNNKILNSQSNLNFNPSQQKNEYQNQIDFQSRSNKNLHQRFNSLGLKSDLQKTNINQNIENGRETSPKNNHKKTYTSLQSETQYFQRRDQLNEQTKESFFQNKDQTSGNFGSTNFTQYKYNTTQYEQKLLPQENRTNSPQRQKINQERKLNNQRERKEYAKSMIKINNSGTDSQDQSTLLPINKTGITHQNGFTNTLTSGNSTNKFSFYKDNSNTQSTAVSFKRTTFNFTKNKLPQLSLNNIVEQAKQRLENQNSELFSQMRGDTNRSNNKSKLARNKNISALVSHNTSINSFLNNSKDKIDYSFIKPQNGIQPLQLTDRQKGNEISIVERDQTTLILNEFSPRDKNISCISGISGPESFAHDQSIKYLNKFIKLNPYLLNQEDKLRKLQQLRQKQYQLINHVSKRNFEDAINLMKELLTISSQEKNIENFAESIAFIGQLHYFNHDLDNALYSFLQLKNLSEIVGNPQIKMKSLILLGQLLSDEQDYDFAISLFRRAIHYSWFLNDKEAETELFDKLGFLYFMKGDISKAKYFHDRSIQHQSENPNSENRQQSVYTVSKLFSNPEKFIPHLNQMVLAKLGLLTEQQDQLRFSTKISADLQLIMLKDDKEITLANYDPSEINPQDLIYSKIVPEGMEHVKGYQIIQKILDQKTSFQPIALRNTQYKDPSSQKIVDYSLLKLSIEEKVEKAKTDVYDNKRLQKKLKEAQVSALINRSTKNQTFFYNHCSPNRNLLGFKYTFKPNSLKMKQYFKRMEEMMLKQEN